MSRLLLVEDEPLLLRGLRETFEEQGYAVVVARNADEAEGALAASPVDLILLDVMLPGEDGFTFLRRLRSAGTETPVILMSVRDQEVDKIQGFRSGADDYVTKPFGLMELLERVKAVLRRTRGPAAGERLTAGDLQLDPATFEVFQRGERLELAPKEFQLLKILISRHGQVVPRDVLFDEVWGYEKIPNTRTLDNHILRLRQKLGDDPERPRYIRTVHGVGYRFEA